MANIPYLSYGAYDFPPDATSFTIVNNPVIGQTGRQNYVDVTWYIDGRVNGNNTSEVVSAVNALEAALIPGQNLVFSITHQLLSANCLQGTIIKNFQWLRGRDNVYGSGAELVLRRTFRLAIFGRVLQTADIDYISYSESVRGIGTGGPVIKPVRSLTGAVQAQQTTAITEFWSRQSGTAVGASTYPTASTPIWQGVSGVVYPPEQSWIEYDSPRILGINGNSQFVTRWSYGAWAPFAMVANPVIPF